MATEIVQSLFGVTPEAYQRAQQDRIDAQATAYANLDPFQQANFAIGRGAYGLAGALGGALGGQDPELQRITMRQQIAGQLNPDDPSTFARGIEMMRQAGDGQGALMLSIEADKFKQQALVRQDEALARQDAALKRAQAAQALAQQQAAQTLAQRAYSSGGELQFYGKNTNATLLDDEGNVMPGAGISPPSFDIQRVAPELLRTPAGRAELKNLVDAQKLMMPETVSIKEGEVLYKVPTTPGGAYTEVVSGGKKPTPFTGDMANAALTLYKTADPTKIFDQFGQPGLDAVGKKADAMAQSKRPVTNVSNTILNNQQKGFGDTLTDNITTNIKAGRTATSTLGVIKNMQGLLDDGVRTGFAQETMLQLGKAGQFFDPEFKVKGLAGQEAFQSFATGVILPQVKQLGVNPTDSDLKFISSGSPSLSKTPEGNKLMLSALELKANRDRDLARFTNEFLNANRTIVTTDPVLAYTKFNDAIDQYTKTSPLYGPAADTLRQRFNALGTQSQGSPAARNAAQLGGLIQPN